MSINDKITNFILLLFPKGGKCYFEFLQGIFNLFAQEKPDISK